MEQIRQELRRFVTANFLLSEDDDGLADEASFLDLGIVDSTGVLELVSFPGAPLRDDAGGRGAGARQPRLDPEPRDLPGAQAPAGRVRRVVTERYPVFSVVVRSPAGIERRERLTADAYLGVVAATSFKQRVRKMLEYYHADRRHYAVVGTPNRLEYD